MQPVVLYGGTFDPIHVGHLISAQVAGEQLGAGRVIFIPSAQPPHKSGRIISAAADRLEMVRLAIVGNDRFERSDCEIHRPGPSYTIETVRQFRRELGPQVQICWLIGADSLGELPDWYQAEQLIKLARIVTASRPGFPTAADIDRLQQRFGPEQTEALLADQIVTPLIEVSGTAIRRKIQADLPIRYLVTEPVRCYIDRRRLLRDRPA